MNVSNLAKKYQQAPVNILSQITTIAKTTPNLIDFSIGDPDLITDQAIIEAAFVDVRGGQTKYTEASGDVELLEAIAHYYKRTYDLAFETHEIRATVGACHGMYLALQAIIDPGEEVIIHEPYFTPYKDQVLAAGGVPVFIPTYEKDDFAINLDILAAAITDKTQALILNSPNNPTGAVFSKEVFQKIAELAEKQQFLYPIRRSIRWLQLPRKIHPNGHIRAKTHHHTRQPLEELRDDRLAHRLHDC
ncbi:aspartate aminotransferase [Listeria riparia FSL S10-1204]|uniref:Aspartate aminotransferase n=1 Tax=Listeria riparia FSL S10-1204 TaxID=1265816 RepID=W7CZL7_9LIST|nr:aspartate aminotransferase [Listeria riparia FSL S10-1204]